MEATQFLLSLRTAYLHNRTFPAMYLTFFVSSHIFSQFMKEGKNNGRVQEEEIPVWALFLRYNIRIKEDAGLSKLEVKVIEGKHEWESR